MTSMKLEAAAKEALKTMKVNKIFRILEDDEYFYFSGCGDHGEPLMADCGCCVRKSDLYSRECYFDDPLWNTPKKVVDLPTDSDMFIKLQDPLAEWGLSVFE